MSEIPSNIFDLDPTVFASDGSRIGEVKDHPELDALRRHESERDRADLACNRAISAATNDGFFVDPVDMDPQLMAKMYPMYCNDGARKAAFERYVEGTEALDAIARELSIPLRTVAKWAEVGHWSRFYEGMAKTLREIERSRLSINRVRKREKILEDQLKVAAKIRETAESRLEEADTAGQLKAASEAAKLAADMEVRALGVGESGGVDEAERRADAAEEKGRTSFIFNFPGGLPPVKPSGVVDV